MQTLPPKSSEGLHFHDAKPIKMGNVTGIASMHRGYLWETRQWCISSGEGLLWIVQLIPHAFFKCDALEFLLGTPVLTRLAGEPVPVSEVESAEGIKLDTQGAPATTSSRRFLRCGDIMIGATELLEFNRPAADAFHTFPLPKGQLWRDTDSSNYLTARISDEAKRWELRESHFFAIHIGTTIPALNVSAQTTTWKVASNSVIFEARQTQGIWHYTFEDGSTKAKLPQIGFGYRDGR